MKLAFDLFSSFDIDIPGLFNLLFQTNCSEQVQFLNDEKKLLFTTFTIALSLYLPFKSPPCVCFFMKMKDRLLLYLQCVGMLKKTSGRFCSYSFILCNLHSRRRFIPQTSSSCYHPPKYESQGCTILDFPELSHKFIFRQLLTKNI